MGFVDSNVLIDILTVDPDWSPWSRDALRAVTEKGGALVTNGVVYAEVSVGFTDQASLDRSLDLLGVRLIAVSRRSLFAAGKAFGAYRRRSRSRSMILPDFIIGAHAAVLGMPLLTRDARRYRTYFPELSLITPER